MFVDEFDETFVECATQTIPHTHLLGEPSPSFGTSSWFPPILPALFPCHVPPISCHVQGCLDHGIDIFKPVLPNRYSVKVSLVCIHAPILEIIPVDATGVIRYVETYLLAKRQSQRRDAQRHHGLLLEKAHHRGIAILNIELEGVLAEPDRPGLFADSAAGRQEPGGFVSLVTQISSSFKQ